MDRTDGTMRRSERFEAQHGFQSGGLATSLESHLDRVHVDDRPRVRRRADRPPAEPYSIGNC